MLLQCPDCGRKGKLPDDLLMSAHTVRCRRCRAKFTIVPVPHRAAAFPPGSASRPRGSAHSAQIGGTLGRLSSEALFSGEDDDSLPEEPGPGDSQYDMAGFFEEEGGGSNNEMPAYRAAGGLREAPGSFEPASTELLLDSPWYDRFIEGLSRAQFLIALGFGSSTLAVLGYFLVRALVGGAVIDASITALIVGCVGTVAFMLLSVSATVLVVLLVDLLKNLRQLIVRVNPEPRVARD
jgi:hypothetical protein